MDIETSFDTEFSFTIKPPNRQVGNIREECFSHAREIYQNHSKILLSVSSGLDSQMMLHCFKMQDIPVECSFLHSPGYNDIEFERLRVLEKKYNFKAMIVTLDPDKLKDEILEEVAETHIQQNHLYQKRYLDKLPRDYHFVQTTNPGGFYIDERNIAHLYMGLHISEISRNIAFNSLARAGGHTFFSNTVEFLYSIVTDDIFKAYSYSYRYLKGNGLSINMNTDAYDVYIKPFLIGKYFKDELIYYPKLSGIENIPYLYGNPRFKEYMSVIPINEIVQNIHLGKTVTYRQNYHKPMES